MYAIRSYYAFNGMSSIGSFSVMFIPIVEASISVKGDSEKRSSFLVSFRVSPTVSACGENTASIEAKLFITFTVELFFIMHIVFEAPYFFEVKAP